MAESTDSPTREALEGDLWTDPPDPKPRHPWPPWCNHYDSAPVGGHLLNDLTPSRDVQCIYFPSLTVWEKRLIHCKLVIEFCCKQSYHWLMPAMADLIEHLMFQRPFGLNHLVFPG